MNNYITVLKPQVVRKKPEIRARGSALRKGGHRPLHLDQLVPHKTRKVGNTYGITEITCNSKNFFKWAKNREGSAEIKDDTGTLITLPLAGQQYKQISAIIKMLRENSIGSLTMTHVL